MSFAADLLLDGVFTPVLMHVRRVRRSAQYLMFFVKLTSENAANMSLAILRLVFWLESSSEMHDAPH